jgi:UDP-N-acetylmuramoyl-L-alanyl-D-glutamate--2,6-diaminopimelate ligase
MKRHLSEFFTQEIANKSGLKNRDGNNDPLITGLEYDSRKIKPGNIFFALPGLHTDGRLYIKDAVNRGASVIILEGDSYSTVSGADKIVKLNVENCRIAMPPIAAAFYDYPFRKMIVTGVTGTEGKSTTVYLIWQLLTLLGKKAGFFSTVQYCLGGEVQWNSEHQTTPEAAAVQKLLWEMADNGCEYAVAETSSHGLSSQTGRLEGMEFRAAVLTNVNHDHLEFHGTWEQYRYDKANLFRALSPGYFIPSIEPFGIINADDKSLHYFTENTNYKIYKFSATGRDADIILDNIESSAWGNWYNIFIKSENKFIDIRDKIPGAFNTNNVLAAILTVSNLLGVPVSEIAPLVMKLNPVHGRMNTIDMGQPFEVVVDYAHTPSAFRAIFPPLRRRLDKTGAKIISLFGSAGERDIQKRMEQGKIAAEYSDIIFITDEDPRSENPMDILEEIARSVEENNDKFKRGENLFLIEDRPAAIRKAFSLAQEKDLVLLLGKGHENSIIYADHIMPYDEVTEAKKALAEIPAR